MARLRLQAGPAFAEELYGIGQISSPDNPDPGYQARLRLVCAGQNYAVPALLPGGQRRRQGSPYGPEVAVEGQLPHQPEAVERRELHLAGCRQNPDGERQVEQHPVLAKVTGRQACSHPPLRPRPSGVGNRGPDPAGSLLDRSTGQPDDVEVRQTQTYVYLDVDRPGVHPDHCNGRYLGEHAEDDKQGV